MIEHINRHKLIYSYLILALLVAGFAYYFKGHREEFRLLRRVSAGYLFGIAALVFLFKLVLSLKFKTLIAFSGIRLKLREWLGLPCVSTMVNYLLPARAGVATQALYLKKAYKFEYSRFAVYLTGFLIFAMLANSASGMLFLTIYYLMHGVFFTAIFFIFLICLILSLTLIFLMYYMPSIEIRWEVLEKLLKGFNFIKNKRHLVLRLLLIQFADIIITGLRLFLAYKALGIEIDILPVFMVGLFASTSAIFSITPANLGIRELFITVSSMLIGETVAVGIMASLLDRTIGAAISFVTGFAFIFVLMPRKKDLYEDIIYNA